MQRVLQLFIEGERVDLFQDEVVKITQTIKNVQEIDKIFTEFTQTFTVPASKKNNKIFKHYYNFNITAGGFDAREKVNSELQINTIPFKKGKVQLNGVNLKDKHPSSYKITFFGDTIALKELLGEDKLSSLDLSEYDRPYGPGSVLGRLSANPNHGSATNEQSIIVPLITHTQRLFYDSSDSTAQTGNLRPATALTGVKWNQLKYAIRVNELIEAIEDKYRAPEYPVNLTFSNDFFKNKSITKMNNLFMWLHRKSGAVENLNGTDETITFIDWDFDNDSPEDTPIIRSGTSIFLPPDFMSGPNWQSFVLQDVDLAITVGNNEQDPYRVQVYRMGVEQPVYQSDITTGNFLQTFDVALDGSEDVWIQGNTYQVAIVASTPITVNGSLVTFNGRGELDTQGFDGEVAWTKNVGTNTQFTTQSIFQFITTQQIPELKIIDLLTGLFKMFNLVAYAEDITDPYSTNEGGYTDQQSKRIIVKTYDDYYADSNSTTYDIDEYVDTSKQTVNVALPYKKVLFKYKDSKSFLAERYRQLANKGWGELSYTEPSLKEIGGKLYKVEIPFGHFQFERLNDGGDITVPKNIMWGWSVNESQNSYKGAPLLFYPIRTNTGGISCGNLVNPDTDEIVTRQTKTFINLPSNTVSLDPTVDKTTIHFDLETNEWTGNTLFNDTLFQEEYFNYIVDIYNRQRRIIKIKANLPLKIFLNLSLSDRMSFRGQVYIINKITTNLLTGESDLELINVINNYASN